MSFRKRKYGPSNERPKGWFDFTPRGYNYMGGGNPVDNYPPLNEADVVSQQHDKDYGNNYWNYVLHNDADEKFIKDLKPTNKYETFAKHWFQAKKSLAEHIPIFDKRTMAAQASHGVPYWRLKGKQKLRYEEVPVDASGDVGTFHTPQKKQKTDKGITPQKDKTMAGPPKDENMEVVAPMAAMSGSTNSRMGGMETSVDPVGFEMKRPFPQTCNAILPYYTTGTFSLATLSGSSAQAYTTIRLNSIYDCLTTLTYAADPTPSAQAADGTVNIPKMRTFFSSIYDYWTVTKCEYQIRYWTATPDLTAEVGVWTYHHGQQVPPYTNLAGTAILTDKTRYQHPNCHHTKFKCRGTLTGEQTCFDNGCKIRGMFMPGDKYVKNTVSEDELHQTWQKGTEVPPQHEYATFICNRTDRSSTGTQLEMAFDIRIIYHVQWKDLKVAYQYMTDETDIAITDYAAQTN